MPVNKPIRLAVYAPPKFGKSHLAAMFVKEFDGFVFDFARVNKVQAPPMTKNAPKPVIEVASDGPNDVGDALDAFINVGLPESQYRLVRSWDDFLQYIEEAKMYRDDMSKKENHRIWIIIDDTTNMRWQCALWAMQKLGHDNLSKTAYSMINMELIRIFSVLEANFNVLFLHQVKSEYIDDKETGRLVGDFYPKNIEHIVDATFEYTEKKDDVGTAYPVINVKSLRSKWRFSQKDYTKIIEFKDITKISPSLILDELHFDKEIR